MAIRIEKLPNEPITIYTAPEDANLGNLEDVNRMLLDVWERHASPVIHIANMLAARVNLDDIATLAANVALGRNALFHHPLIVGVIVVTQDPALELAARSLGTKAYGNVPVKVCHAMQDALDYARQQVHQQAQR